MMSIQKNLNYVTVQVYVPSTRVFYPRTFLKVPYGIKIITNLCLISLSYYLCPTSILHSVCVLLAQEENNLALICTMSADQQGFAYFLSLTEPG
jgi:hypothetical protein